MIKIVLSVFLLAFCFNSPDIFAQAGRTPPTDQSKKANQRPVTTTEPTGVEDSEAVIDDDLITIDTEIVTLPVRVLNRRGGFVSGLTKEDFKVYEDGSEQEIAFFSNEQEPFTVALVLDMSYSSTFKIDEIQQAALTFITKLRPADRVMVVSFDMEMHILCEPTRDRDVINRAIIRTRISSGTSLYETVDYVVNRRFDKIKGRKAIVLFTDGVDTTSERTDGRQNLRDVSELDALIYPISYDTFADVQAMQDGRVVIADDRMKTTPPIGGGSIPTGQRNPLPFPLPTGSIGGSGQGIPGSRGTTREEYELAEEYLNQLALRTGGVVYQANSADRLNRAFTKIAEELREFYSLGYYPSEKANAGARRAIKVKVSQNGVVVRTRDSYVIGDGTKPE